jgi:hypothetical protein
VTRLSEFSPIGDCIYMFDCYCENCSSITNNRAPIFSGKSNVLIIIKMDWATFSKTNTVIPTGVFTRKYSAEFVRFECMTLISGVTCILCVSLFCPGLGGKC